MRVSFLGKGGSGKTLHLEDNEFEKIEDSIEKEYKIKLDPSKTILYGKCNECI